MITRVTRRRIRLFTLVVFATGVATLMMADLVWGMPMRGWNGVMITLFAVLFAAVAFGAMQAFLGFVKRWSGGDPCRIEHSVTPAEEAATELAPTAIVLAVYNENVSRVYAGLRAIYQSLERTGQLAHYDFFILSDSTDPDRWIEEELGWAQLSNELNAHGRIFYRKRRVNTNKKAGNIADFCRRWGARYRYMVVLDADSFVAGDTLVRMVRLMEANPAVALIQTAPRLFGAETLFARLQQFSAALYGPIFIAGANYWQQGEANYWGHNAIIRVAPFIDHCALPRLPGHEPLGGKILSHDFVEAALLRRAGWGVWLLTDTRGSYEEGPPTLIDALKRDRRWCQGNMQHLWLLLARGLYPVSRLHLFLGVFSYAASLLWLLFLALGTLLAIGFDRTGLSWVPTPGLATTVGVSPEVQFAILTILTFGLLFVPKILAVVDLFRQPGGPAGFGGRMRVIVSVFLEMIFSAALAPVLMLFHAKFVLLSLFGDGVHWGTQRRTTDDRADWRAAVQVHGGSTLAGLIWMAVIWVFAPQLIVWMAFVLTGIIFSIPLSALTGRTKFGRAARALGLFCTPEEALPPIGQFQLQETAPRLPVREDLGLTRAVVDPYVNAVHVCLLRERTGQADEVRQYFEETREKLLRDGPAALRPQDKFAVLSDAESMDWLHTEVWRRPAPALAPWWRRALHQDHAVPAL